MSPCTRQPTLKILMSVILPPFMLQLCPIVQLSCLVFTTLPNVKTCPKNKDCSCYRSIISRQAARWVSTNEK